MSLSMMNQVKPDALQLVQSGKCPLCAESVYGLNNGELVAEFRDELSFNEFKLSGMCQECQDKFFGMAESYDEDE